jgi:hypothetical protein
VSCACFHFSRVVARAEANEKLEAVRLKWTEAKHELDEAQNASEESWGDVQERFQRAHSDLKATILDERRWLADKIDPD